MKKLIEYFIKYPAAGNVVMVLILILGFLSFLTIKVNFFPEPESKAVSIQVVYPGASPEEIENQIIRKIEDNLKGITGVDRVSSVSSENAGSVTAELQTGFDADLVVADVKNAVDRIANFPTGMEPPVVAKVENLNFAISFAIAGPVSLRTLKEKANEIENDLRAVDGISKVNITGAPEEEIEIAFREDDMRAYNISFAEAAAAVREFNIDVTGGAIKGEREEMLIRARGKQYSADGLLDIVVKTTPDGRVLRLMDVASVRDQWSDKPDRSFLNGQPSIVFNIQNTVNEDILFIADYVKEYIAKFNKDNTEIKADIIRDGSVTVSQRIELLTNNGIVGLILVVIFLSLFLNIRLSFWVAASIPIAFMGMFILAAYAGVTINVMSLFGMILVIGILVDDGIVIAESIFQEHEKGKKPVRAAIDGTMKVLPAVAVAVLTTVIAFTTFFFLEGRLGDFAPDLAFVVIATLLFSLIEAAIILPGHVAHSKALKPEGQKGFFAKIERFTTKGMDFMRDKVYAPALRFSLKNVLLTMVLPLGFFMLTIAAFRAGIINTTFFPFIEQDAISISLELAPGSRDSLTFQLMDKVEEAVWNVNDSYKAQREDGLDIVTKVEKKLGPGAHQGSLNVVLLDNETRATRSYLIANAIRDSSGLLPGVEKSSFGVRSAFGKPVSVSLLGNNLDELQAAKDRLKHEMELLTSIKDVVDNDQQGNREVVIALKPEGEALGLSLADVITQVRQGFFGNEIQRLQRGEDEVKVWVRYALIERGNLGDLENMRIRLPGGIEYPFRDVATYEIRRGVVSINHLYNQREVRIEADLASPDVSAPKIMLEIEDEILPGIMADFPSIKYSFEGQSRETAKTAKSGARTLPIVLLLMFLLIVFTFRDFWQTLMVYLMLPLGFIGVGWGHWLHDSTVSLLSFFGIIALIGVMVNDSLVLVSTFNQYIKEGKKFREALYEAAVSRFRPILLTSVTTIAGLGPLILEKSFQAQFLIPMAISIAYGLAVATFTTLLVLPASLFLLNQVKRFVHWWWYNEWLAEEEFEPAYRELKIQAENPEEYENDEFA